MNNISQTNTVLFSEIRKNLFSNEKTSFSSFTFFKNEESILNQTKAAYPAFSKSAFQHAEQIYHTLSLIFEQKALDELSQTEQIILFISTLFHDLKSYFPAYYQSPARVRESHLQDFKQFLFNIISDDKSHENKEITKLIETVIFIIKSLHLPWEAISSNENFRNSAKIGNATARTGVLLSLLRICDLLAFMSTHKCDVLSKRNPDYQKIIVNSVTSGNFSSLPTYELSPTEIILNITTQNKDEHIYWSEWFGHLKNDIQFVNTSVFIGDNKHFQLPAPTFEISKAAAADYDIWPLRFELDESGRIWKIISQAVYTSRYDFLREMIQNAIDAALFCIYDAEKADIPAISPRSWSLQNYQPQVLILFSEKSKFLEIKDNGTGMNEQTLQYFLFKIAQTGYEQKEKRRDFQFPAIAKFGIGFISILLRANKVIIHTKTEDAISGQKITLQTEAKNAYSETEACTTGTSIQLFLKDAYSATEMVTYLTQFYRYPSVPVFYIDLDKTTVLSQLAESLDIELPETVKNLNENKNLKGVEFDFSEYQNDLSETEQKVRQALDLNQAELEEQEQQFKNIYLKIALPEIQRPFLEEPVLFYLDNEFDIYKISTIEKVKSNNIPLGLLFIPVRFTSFEMGIEWQSIHGLIIHKNEIKRSLVRYTGLANEFDDPEKMIFMSQEEIDDDENYDSEQIVIDTLDVMRRFRSQNNSYSEFSSAGHGNIYEELFFLSDNLMSRRDEFDDYPHPYLDKKGSRIKTNSTANDELFKLLFHSLGQFTNEIFQDGIKMPVSGWAVAPLGMCRALANFTGNARLELNVTRNAINESPILINNWIDNYASTIHSKILEEMQRIFKILDCNFKMKDLVVPKSDTGHNVLYRYVSNALINRRV